MRLALALVVTLLLSACAVAPAPPVPATSLFNDALFGPAAVNADAAAVFGVDAEMRRYLKDAAGQRHAPDRAQWLFDALYRRAGLQLEYDASATRNATEAFHERAGNCLSLVIMTAALAKEMGLAVRYHDVQIEDTWSREGALYVSFTHVNLSLGERDSGHYAGRVMLPEPLTIDFLPPRQQPQARRRDVTEPTLLAMYFNNRAVEALTSGRLDDAYAWARAALTHDAAFAAAYNTLAVVYRQRRAPADAEHVLRRLLQLQPDNLLGLSNLALALNDQGRSAEARLLDERVRARMPEPPYALFDRGLAAWKAGDYVGARALFAREVDRAPYEPEFRAWLAQAEWQLGHADDARRQLARARDTSPTRQGRELYAAKLERLREATAMAP